MAITINGATGIDMGNTPVSNASQVDSAIINENGDNVATISNLVGFKNYIINGNFDIWQRYTGAATGGGFLADRFNVYNSVGISLLQDRATLLDADKVSSGTSSRYGLNIYSDAASSIVILQPVERVRSLAGKTATLSFHAKVSSGSSTGSVFLTQAFGTGGTPSSNVNTVAQSFTVTTTMTKFVFTFNLPLITYKVLGTNKNDYLGVQISKHLGTSNNITITEIQLEEGSVATPFEQRPIGLELSLCQRYYELGKYKLYIQDLNKYKAVAANFKVTKRVVPTVTFSGANPPTAVEEIDINYVQVIRSVSDQEISFNFVANAEM